MHETGRCVIRFFEKRLGAYFSAFAELVARLVATKIKVNFRAVLSNSRIRPVAERSSTGLIFELQKQNTANPLVPKNKLLGNCWGCSGGAVGMEKILASY